MTANRAAEPPLCWCGERHYNRRQYVCVCSHCGKRLDKAEACMNEFRNSKRYEHNELDRKENREARAVREPQKAASNSAFLDDGDRAAKQKERILRLAAELYTSEGAELWVKSRNEALGGRSPDDLIAAGEGDKVEQFINAMADGAYW